jgi:hypothetical protein
MRRELQRVDDSIEALGLEVLRVIRNNSESQFNLRTRDRNDSAGMCGLRDPDV